MFERRKNVSLLLLSLPKYTQVDDFDLQKRANRVGKRRVSHQILEENDGKWKQYSDRNIFGFFPVTFRSEYCFYFPQKNEIVFSAETFVIYLNKFALQNGVTLGQIDNF